MRTLDPIKITQIPIALSSGNDINEELEKTILSWGVDYSRFDKNGDKFNLTESNKPHLEDIINSGEVIGFRDGDGVIGFCVSEGIHYFSDKELSEQFGIKHDSNKYNANGSMVINTGKSKFIFEVEDIDREYLAVTNKLLKNINNSIKDRDIDSLTGLYRREKFEKDAKKVISKAVKRDNSNVAMLFFDIDHFKSVNDTYGHPDGDKILSTIGKYMSGSVRPDSDVVGRYGGEELVCLLSDVTEKSAEHIANRMRMDIAELDVKPKVTVSIGVDISTDYVTGILYGGKSTDAFKHYILFDEIRDVDQNLVKKYGSKEELILRFEYIRKFTEKWDDLPKKYDSATLKSAFTKSDDVRVLCEDLGIAMLIKHADTALYEAKDTGRNKVVMYNDNLSVKEINDDIIIL